MREEVKGVSPVLVLRCENRVGRERGKTTAEVVMIGFLEMASDWIGLKVLRQHRDGPGVESRMSHKYYPRKIAISACAARARATFIYYLPLT